MLDSHSFNSSEGEVEKSQLIVYQAEIEVVALPWEVPHGTRCIDLFLFLLLTGLVRQWAPHQEMVVL